MCDWGERIKHSFPLSFFTATTTTILGTLFTFNNYYIQIISMKFISAVTIILFVSTTTSGQDNAGPCDDGK